VQIRRSSSDNKIKDVMIRMSRKRNMLCKIIGAKSRYKLFDFRVARSIEMKIKMPVIRNSWRSVKARVSKESSSLRKSKISTDLQVLVVA